MRYGKLSKLVILLEQKGEGKLNALEYIEVILDERCLTSGRRVWKTWDMYGSWRMVLMQGESSMKRMDS